MCVSAYFCLCLLRGDGDDIIPAYLLPVELFFFKLFSDDDIRIRACVSKSLFFSFRAACQRHPGFDYAKKSFVSRHYGHRYLSCDILRQSPWTNFTGGFRDTTERV